MDDGEIVDAGTVAGSVLTELPGAWSVLDSAGVYSAGAKVDGLIVVPVFSVSGTIAVSYTHLDVYKRQVPYSAILSWEKSTWSLISAIVSVRRSLKCSNIHCEKLQSLRTVLKFSCCIP